MNHRLLTAAVTILLAAAAALAEEPVRMVSSPDLSPDGRTVAFAWRGDVWSVPVEGGAARRLTLNPAVDAAPFFSPDGTEIAFTSDRDAGTQVYVMPAGGGEPERLTHDTNGYSLHGWFPDGRSLLVLGESDRFWHHSRRFYRIVREGRAAPEMLFDAYGDDGCLSPDGSRLLFTREGVQWWRKGYRGPGASQIWVADLETGEFTALVREETESRWPRWLPGGRAILYAGGGGDAMGLMRLDLETGERRALTAFADDSVVSPDVSADGGTVVFRHLFDLYRLRPGIDDEPVRIPIVATGDRITPPTARRVEKRATQAAFSSDGLEVALAAGGDLWVMDTVLCEPRRITSTPEEEEDPVFLPDGSALYFLSDAGGQGDVWRAERGDAEAFWWRNETFPLTRITEDQEAESLLTVSPDGGRLAFVRSRGDLVTTDLTGGDERVLVRSFAAPQYAWSPDGRWIAYVTNDDDFNADLWIVPVDGSRPAVNVSRHPDDEGFPAWSPDGRVLAFTGRRWDRETDICYVWLRREDDEATKRDRTLEEALEKMRKERKPPKKAGKPPEKEAGAKEGEKGTAEKKAEEKAQPEEKEEEEPAETAGPEVVIDFEGIHERVERIPIPNTEESGLFWSPDSKRLAFAAEVDGRRGTYTVEIPGDAKPRLLTTAVGAAPRWVEKGNRVLWLVGGVPASSTGPKTESYPFTVRLEVSRVARLRAAFDLAWRTMRDYFYDGNLNNRNWDEVREKYRETAATSPDRDTFARVVNLMLGELNGSHLGFGASQEPPAGVRQAWSEVTAYPGLRWDPTYRGPGLKVAQVIPDGPADQVRSRILEGEVVLEIDGTPVDPDMDLTLVLNGPPDRELPMRVRDAQGGEREVRLRPITLRQARRLLYRMWIDDSRAKVAALSGGSLGYLHVRGMNWSSFQEFERELYAEGCGKDGLVIDVRDNGGGFTTDHLLTSLTQPVHAITVPRGGGPGYPQDRKVYATWSKPIVVLINQRSFSNAEIFAHAIRTLGRGKLVGVRTAGGVISTGGRRIMDIGWIRTPTRGWFLIDSGEDMELNGAVPHHEVWPEPGELPTGLDRQLERAVSVLLADVDEWKARPRPRLRKASER